MARLCLLLGLLVSFQLWSLPLSRAAGSLRDVASSGDGFELGSTSADAAFFDTEIVARMQPIDGGAKLEEKEATLVKIRQTRAERVLATQNVTNNSAVDRFHREEREAGRADHVSFQTRIIGGKVASASEDSFAVSIQDRHGTHYCGGTLVSKDCVLTAAHCSDRVTGKGPIKIVIGRHALSSRSEGEALVVRAERIHPRYKVDSWQYDFALMFTKRPVAAEARVIKLNSDPRVPRRGTLVRVFGWGDTHPDENVYDPSDALRVASLRTVPNGQCDSMFRRYGRSAGGVRKYVHGDMMCAKNRKRDGCQGDSGGPLTHRGRQVGLTSWGAGCNVKGLPGVYARISSAYHWIRRNVCAMSKFPDPQFKCRPGPW